MYRMCSRPRPRGTTPAGLQDPASPPLSFRRLAATTWQQVHRSLLIAGLAGAAVGCRAKPKAEEAGAPAGPPAGAAGQGQGTAQLRTGIAPMLVADSAGIRHYLESVDTVKGATFDVTWSPNAVRLTRDQTLRSLRRVSRDGATFTFAAGDPTIAGLKPGQILLVWGIALRKVTAVESQGPNTVVRTAIVSLPEAIPNGHIAWTAPTGFGQGIVSPSVLPADTAAKRASLGRPAQGIFRFASWRQGDGQEGAGQEPGGDQGGEGEAEEAELPHHTDGEFGGYEYEIGYANVGGRLDFQLEARSFRFGDVPGGALDGSSTFVLADLSDGFRGVQTLAGNVRGESVGRKLGAAGQSGHGEELTAVQFESLISHMIRRSRCESRGFGEPFYPSGSRRI